MHVSTTVEIMEKVSIKEKTSVKLVFSAFVEYSVFGQVAKNRKASTTRLQIEH